MNIVFYRSNDDEKYYLNTDNKYYIDKNILCNSCNTKTEKYYIFSRKISAIFDNIKTDKNICYNCYIFKKKIQDKFSIMN